MARILEIEEIAPAFKSYVIHNPVIARRHRAGQFVIVLLHEESERIYGECAAALSLLFHRSLRSNPPGSRSG